MSQTQKERQARNGSQMRDGRAEDKVERKPSNRETEAKKKITLSDPTHLGAGSPPNQWVNLPASASTPVPWLSGPRPTPSLLVLTQLTGLAGPATPQDGQIDLEWRALRPAARAGFPEHRGHGDAAERDKGPR